MLRWLQVGRFEGTFPLRQADVLERLRTVAERSTANLHLRRLASRFACVRPADATGFLDRCLKLWVQ